MKNKLQKLFVKSTATLKQCMKIINENIAYKIVLVIDDNLKIKGVITDGDIRRALLNGKNFETTASDIMNKSPLTIPEFFPKESARNLMTTKGISSLPVINGNNEVVDIVVFTEDTDVKIIENPVFLMAGGFGSRLQPLTDNCPKPMLKVGPRPLLETIILRLKAQGFRNFYISIYYLAEQIKEHFGDGSQFGVNVNYVVEDSPLGTGGALSMLPPSISKLPLLMLNGDILTNIDFKQLLEYHNKNNNAATMCVKQYQYQVPYGVIEGDGHIVTSINEKPTHSFFVNAGIYVLNNSIVTSLDNKEVKDMPSLLEEKMESGETVSMFPIHEYWLDIGRMEDLQRAQKDFDNLGLE